MTDSILIAILGLMLVTWASVSKWMASVNRDVAAIRQKVAPEDRQDDSGN